MLKLPSLAALLCLLAAPLAAHGATPTAFDDTGKLDARAEPRPAVRAPDELRMYSYAKPDDPHYIRAALEVLGILVVGNVDYLQNTTARGGTLRAGDRRWDLRYDWRVFRDKLTGDYYKVDTNHFNTNYISHPFAGTLYYTAARSNHLSILESFGYAALGALMWEYFGELREEVSINDAIVTPTAGLALGETMMQLGGFFSRGRNNFANSVLAAVLSPARVLNDGADGNHPLRSLETDGLGFPTDIWHRFRLFAGAGTTIQRGAATGARTSYTDATFGLDMEVVNLPGYGGAAKRETTFSDGNMAELMFEAAISNGELADASMAARFMPAGYYWRDADADRATGLHGDGAVVGLLSSFEYGVHDFDRDRARPRDLYAILSPIGARFELKHASGPLRLRSRLDIGGDFAGVTAYALPDYQIRTGRDDSNLQTVVRQNGYYHALGVSLAPSIELAYDRFGLGGAMRADILRGIEGFDEQQDRIQRELSLADRRFSWKTWVSARLAPLELRLGLQRRTRVGEVGTVSATQSDTTANATLGLVF